MTEDDEAEEAAVDPDDTKEDEDKEFGTVEYFTDRVLEDGVLWWVETQEATWCLDTNIPRISKYNKMRAAGEKGEFMLRFDGQNQNKRKRGKTRGKDIGVDCCRREFVDTFLKQRRPMSEQQWAAIGVLDWQATYLICVTREN